jgi:exosortase/archaeosortase
MSEHLDVLTSEVALCVLLYALFRPLGATLALMLASFRLVMTAIHGANMLNQFVVLNLIGEGATAALLAGCTAWRCCSCLAMPRRPSRWP